MRRLITLLACGALTLAFTGCDSSGSDDGGMIMLMDSGRTDGGARDSGTTDPCPPQMADAPDMPMACAASTLTCLMTATTPTAQQACITADPNAANCGDCIDADLLFTCTNATTGGCADQYGELLCCLIAECPTPEMTCVNTALAGPCATDVTALNTCFNTAQTARACGVTGTCFMTGTPTDAGPAPDAGPADAG